MSAKTYRISFLRIENFKIIRTVEIRPDADAHVYLVGGKNANGKSTLADAVDAVTAGKSFVPVESVRRGEETARIYLEYNGGELCLERTMTKDGGGSFKVHDPTKKLARPQELLDTMIGARFVDPLGFLRVSPKEQRNFLLALVDRDGAIAKLDETHGRVFDARTQTGREQKHADGELVRLGVEREVGEPTDVAALAKELEELSAKQREGDGIGSAAKMAEAARDGIRDRLANTRVQIAELEKRLAAMKADAETQSKALIEAENAASAANWKLSEVVEAWRLLAPRRAEVDALLANANAHNATVFANKAFNVRREAAVKATLDLKNRYEAQGAKLESIEREKNAILAAANLPVPHLGFDKDGVTLNGVPFVQASAAERIRVAIGLAIASSPKLDDVWIRDAALLDDDSLAIVEEMAVAANKRIWLEVISTDREGAIIMKDGEVVES